MRSIVISYVFDVGKPIHRRDTETAEKTQRKDEKSNEKRESKEKRREEKKNTLLFFSLRFLCGFCVSAVNRLC
jgi:5'-3' exonuclease